MDPLTRLLFTGVETEQLTGECQAKVQMTQLQTRLLGQHSAHLPSSTSPNLHQRRKALLSTESPLLHSPEQYNKALVKD